MPIRRGSYYREADFTIEVGVASQGTREIDVTVGYVLDDGEIQIDTVTYAVPSKFKDVRATYPLDWMVDDAHFNALLVEAVSQYETDMAEGYRESEAEAKMEELRERRFDNAA